MEVDEIHIVPNHIVEITIEKLLKTRNERVKVGKSEFVRVTVCGIIAKIEVNESDVSVVLEDVARLNRVTATKIFTASWTRDRVGELRVGDFATVHGKVRMAEGSVFLNALAIQKASRSEYEARESMAKLAEIYFETSVAVIENGTTPKLGTKYGMTDKKTSLDRFPIGMLEESTSSENNGGVWPRELEELAGITTVATNGADGESSDETDEEEEVDDQKSVEEEDSFDRPVQMDALRNGTNGVQKKKEEDVVVPKEEVVAEEEEEFDSFDAIQ